MNDDTGGNAGDLGREPGAGIRRARSARRYGREVGIEAALGAVKYARVILFYSGQRTSCLFSIRFLKALGNTSPNFRIEIVEHRKSD